MPEKQSLEEIISKKPGVKSVQDLCYGDKDWHFDNLLLRMVLENPNLGLEPVDLMIDYPKTVLQANAIAKDDLSIKHSYFFNNYQNVYPVSKIPSISIEKVNETDKKIQGIFECLPYFKFGGMPFQCSHKIPLEFGTWTEKPKTEDRCRFKINYGINLDNVYISLNELITVAEWNDVFSEIDDFFVVGANGGKLLTIIDNDMDYSVCGSNNKTECHFKPVFVLDRGVPVKYIKTADDNHPFERKYIPERQLEYELQRKHVLHNLGDIFKQTKVTNDDIIGYPTEIDFVVKTGLHQFTVLSYDRFKNNGDFWITNVQCHMDGTDPQTVIKKCDFQNLHQNINAIQRARADHFNKMYAGKNIS